MTNLARQNYNFFLFSQKLVMSHRHHDHGSEHRSCEAMASTSGLQENIVESTSYSNILSDTDSGVADTDETSNRPPRSSRATGTRPKVTSSETASSSSTASSSVDLHTLRDPSHYEELNVIGNGESRVHENFL